MFRAAVLALCLGAASAFVPAARPARATAVRALEGVEIGASSPVKGAAWDPLNLLENADQAKFDRLRFTEIKHGRIAQIAVVGYLIGASNVRWAGFVDLEHTLKFSDVPGGFAAFDVLPPGYFAWLVIGLGGIDFHMARDYTGNPEFPGDIRNGCTHLPENARSGVLQMWDNLSEEEKISKRTIEINNGRAAQMGILALMVHEQLGNLDSILPAGAPGIF
eukprot:CAMPEP_0172596782 /NCGR_PEP_ID=MMETSP1068-20121228/16617_1 /TAXON_ID=35684 /ORGANISM="Pseudopedinella elastica, Strain CCMP716" /LENGTH=219 /DNA_ID=CAMNT_0013395973 /DNA_START=78 /DNA_END=737 /DNA_ORIENTATION=+